MYKATIHSLLSAFILLLFQVHACDCDLDLLNFRMNIIPDVRDTMCAISWSFGYIAENFTHLHIYSDEYRSDISYNNTQFDYCFKQQLLYLDINFGSNCLYAGYINIFLQSVFLESIPFEPQFSHYIYYLNQTIQSSDYSLNWIHNDIYSIHSYVLFSNKNCCIQFASKEICLTANTEYYLPPPSSSSLMLVNRQRASLFIFPLMRHPSNSLSYRSLHAEIASQLVKENQYCQVDFSFYNRTEWANGILFSPSLPKSLLYVLVWRDNHFDFVDVVDSSNTAFVKFGYFLKEPFERIRLVSNLIQVCNQAFRMDLVSLNQIKPLSEEFHFFNRETLRLQLPCSAVYSYQLIPQDLNTRQNKNLKLPYEVNPQTGLLTNKKPVSASFSVMGIYKQHNSVLSFYAIQPSSVTVSLSVFYKDCSQLDLYRLVIEVKSSLPLYTRFLISTLQQPLFFIENNRGARTIIRPFCSIGHELTFWNIDGASGTVTLFRGDLSIFSSPFSPQLSSVRIPLSIIQSKNYKERTMNGVTTREFTFNNPMERVLMDVLVFSKTVQSITSNQQLLYKSNQPVSHGSFIRLFHPVTSESAQQRLLIEYQKESKELEVHSILHGSLFYDSHIISTSLFNDTLFITSLHHELFCLNVIQMESQSVIPSFSVEMLQNNHWKEIGHISSGLFYPLALIYQVSNHELSTQYRLHFDRSVEPVVDEPRVGLPSFQFGYDRPVLWDQDVLTPGYRIIVVKDCYNWIVLNEEEEFDLKSVLLLNYNLYFDWKHEVVFGTAIEWIQHSFSSRELDASLVSSRIQLVSCQSSQITVEISSTSTLDLVIWDEELLFRIPSSLALSSVALCLDRNSYFTISSSKTMLIEIVEKESQIRTSLFVSPTPSLFNTFYSAVSLSEYAMPAVDLKWQAIPFADETYNASFVYVRIAIKDESSLVRLETGMKSVMIVEVMMNEKKVVGDKEVSVLQLLVWSREILVKLRLTQPIPFNQFHSLLNVHSKATCIQEIAVTPADLFVNPYHHFHAVVPLSLTHPVSVQYQFSDIVHVFNLHFHYQLIHASSLVLHLYVNCQNTSSVLHNAVLTQSNSTQWSLFSLELSSPVYFTSISFAFDFVPFSFTVDSHILLKNLTLNSMKEKEVIREHEVIKEESKPLLEKLQTIAKDKEEVIPPTKKKPSKFCKEEKDVAHSVIWPRTPGVTHIRKSCPSGGKLHRFCDSDGNWSAVDGKCKKTTKTEDLLHRSFTRVSPTASTKPSQPVQTPPLLFCKEEKVKGVLFPSTMQNKTIAVSCAQPLIGTLYRTCSINGTWEEPIGECSNCPKNSFSFFNSTVGELQCKQCPSGTAFIRGNPLNPVKCYGKYFSEGGTSDCLLCDGETRGSKEMGNIACKPCENGVVVGMKCVNTTRCSQSGQSVKVGSLWMSPCDQGKRGIKTQMCKYQPGSSSGILGLVNEEGCYDVLPAIGHFKMEIALTLQNIHSSIFRKKYDDNKEIAASPAVHLVKQALTRSLQTVEELSVQYVNYYDLHENNQFATVLHFVIDGKIQNACNMTLSVYSSLNTRLPDMTMDLKEQNAYLFHYYFILKHLQVIWYDENRAFCEAEDGWPETPVNKEAKKLCESAMEIGYSTRMCTVQNNRVVWGEEKGSCALIKDIQYTIRVTLNSPKTGRSYERKEFFERLMEEVNCDRIQDMKQLRFESPESDFKSIFKDCKMDEGRLFITFLSNLAPTREMLDFFSELGIVESVAVIREGQSIRSSFALEFSVKAMKLCPSQYVFCNDKSILSGYYCHYHTFNIR